MKSRKYDHIPFFSNGRGLQLFSILIFCFLGSQSYCQNYGLEFKGYEVPKDERTELIIPHERDFSFDDEFELSFDFQFIPNRKYTYGYIFRVILEDTLNIDLVYSPVTNLDTKNFNVVLGHERTNISFDMEAKKLVDTWIKFRFKVNSRDNKLTLYVDDTSFTEEGLVLGKGKHTSKIIFGACDFDRFKNKGCASDEGQEHPIIQ